MEEAKPYTMSLTKECMTTALLMLLAEKPYEDISVTDITTRAGVSRMAYYRNYSSKDDILVDYILCRAATLELKIKNHGSVSLRSLIVEICLFLQNHYSFVSAAVSIGQGERLMNEMTKKLIAVFPEIAENTEFRYITAFYVGAVIGVLKEWVAGDMAESVYEIADIICRQMDPVITEQFEHYGNQTAG